MSETGYIVHTAKHNCVQNMKKKRCAKRTRIRDKQKKVRNIFDDLYPALEEHIKSFRALSEVIDTTKTTTSEHEHDFRAHQKITKIYRKQLRGFSSWMVESTTHQRSSEAIIPTVCTCIYFITPQLKYYSFIFAQRTCRKFQIYNLASLNGLYNKSYKENRVNTNWLKKLIN